MRASECNLEIRIDGRYSQQGVLPVHQTQKRERAYQTHHHCWLRTEIQHYKTINHGTAYVECAQRSAALVERAQAHETEGCVTHTHTHTHPQYEKGESDKMKDPDVFFSACLFISAIIFASSLSSVNTASDLRKSAEVIVPAGAD